MTRINQGIRNDETELWLIRHGESQGNREGRYQGHADMPLSALGREQARLLAERLNRIHQIAPFAALYSSDLQRAVQTAQPIGELLGMSVQRKSGLREIDVGAWAGLTFQEIAHRYPDEWASTHLNMDPELERGGGESYRQAQIRIVSEINNIARQHVGSRVLIVFHGGVLRAYVAFILGLSLTNLRRVKTFNTSINRVAWYANHADEAYNTESFQGAVLSINDVAHLEMNGTRFPN